MVYNGNHFIKLIKWFFTFAIILEIDNCLKVDIII